MVNHPNRSKSDGEPKITKHKDGNGGWRIHVGGKRSSLSILKGDAPKFRQSQTYDVFADGEDGYLDHMFEARSVAGALERIKRIAKAINGDSMTTKGY